MPPAPSAARTRITTGYGTASPARPATSFRRWWRWRASDAIRRGTGSGGSETAGRLPVATVPTGHRQPPLSRAPRICRRGQSMIGILALAARAIRFGHVIADLAAAAAARGTGHIDVLRPLRADRFGLNGLVAPARNVVALRPVFGHCSMF